MVILFLVGMMVCLSRNNGVYIVILSMVCLILYVQKERSRYVILLICLMVCYQGLEGYGTAARSRKRLSKRSTFYSISTDSSIYKRISRRSYFEREKAINDILSYDGIKENYNPEISDFVKILLEKVLKIN